MSITISVSLPDELFNLLDNFSKKEERTKSYYIKKALENYFAQKLQEEEDYKDVINYLSEFKASKKDSNVDAASVASDLLKKINSNGETYEK